MVVGRLPERLLFPRNLFRTNLLALAMQITDLFDHYNKVSVGRKDKSYK